MTIYSSNLNGKTFIDENGVRYRIRTRYVILEPFRYLYCYLKGIYKKHKAKKQEAKHKEELKELLQECMYILDLSNSNPEKHMLLVKIEDEEIRNELKEALLISLKEDIEKDYRSYDKFATTMRKYNKHGLYDTNIEKVVRYLISRDVIITRNRANKSTL